MKKYLRRFMFDYKTNLSLIKSMIVSFFTFDILTYNKSKLILKMNLKCDLKKEWDKELETYIYKVIRCDDIKED